MTKPAQKILLTIHGPRAVLERMMEGPVGPDIRTNKISMDGYELTDDGTLVVKLTYLDDTEEQG